MSVSNLPKAASWRCTAIGSAKRWDGPLDGFLSN
jgi:hypothetical protein